MKTSSWLLFDDERIDEYCVSLSVSVCGEKVVSWLGWTGVDCCAAGWLLLLWVDDETSSCDASCAVVNGNQSVSSLDC